MVQIASEFLWGVIMYYVVNQQKDTLTFYFPDGTSDF